MITKININNKISFNRFNVKNKLIKTFLKNLNFIKKKNS